MADFTYGAGKMDEPNTFCGTRMLRDLKIKIEGGLSKEQGANLQRCLLGKSRTL